MDVTTRQALSAVELIRLLAGRAATRGVPDHVVDYCVQATSHKLGPWSARPLAPRDAARLRSYFEGVVRRRTLRSRGTELLDARRRYILASIAEDLRAAGVGRDRVLRELSDFCGASVPDREIVGIVDALEPRCA